MPDRRALLTKIAARGQLLDLRLRAGGAFQAVQITALDDEFVYFETNGESGFVPIDDVLMCIPASAMHPPGEAGKSSSTFRQTSARSGDAYGVLHSYGKPEHSLSECQPDADASYHPDVAELHNAVADWRRMVLRLTQPAPILDRPSFVFRPANAVLTVSEAKQTWTNGLDCLHENKFESALTHFSNLARGFGSSPPALHNAGCAALALQRTQIAAAFFNRAFKAGLIRSGAGLVQATAACELDGVVLEIAGTLIRGDLPQIHLLFLYLLSVSCEAGDAVPLLRRRIGTLRSLDNDQLAVLRMADYFVVRTWKPTAADYESWPPTFDSESSQSFRKRHLAEIEAVTLTIGQAGAQVSSHFGSERHRVRSGEEVADRLLREARSKAQSGEHPEALRLLRQAFASGLASTPELERLESDWRKSATRETLPKGKGPYAAAKQAQLSDEKRDLRRAEELFRTAIREGDNFEAAVKDLVSLLQQTKRGKEALDLLQEHLPRMHNRRSALNTLATLQQHLQLHDEAVHTLREILRLTQGNQDVVSVRQRTALSLFKSHRYDEAEGELRLILDLQPTNTTAARWLSALREATRSGRYEDAETVFVLDAIGEIAGELTPFARLSMSLSQYEGARARAIESGRFTMADVQGLEDAAKELGAQRPKDRGRFYLSAARILSEIAPSETEKIRDYLRRAFSSKGLAAVQDGHPWDVARAFWCEAFAASTAWFARSEHEDTADRYLLTLTGDRSVVLAKMGPLREAVSQLQRRQQLTERFFSIVLHASLFNTNIAERILRAVYQDNQARVSALEYLLSVGINVSGAAESESVFLQLWTAPRATAVRHLRDIQDQIAACMQRLAPAVDALQDATQTLHALTERLFFQLDRDRLQRVCTILENAATYFEETTYEEREGLHSLVETEVNNLVSEIADGPTQLSLCFFGVIVQSVRQLITQHFREVQRASVPVLSMRLAVDHYHQRQDDSIQLQLELSNSTGSSPVSGVVLSVLSDTPHFHASNPVLNVSGAIRGGNERTVHVPLKLTSKALLDQAFPVEVSCSYRLRDGSERSMPAQSFAVRLNPPGSWMPIDNPYEAGARGQSVGTQMFYGRDDLLNWLESALTTSDELAKCLVLYGQKRVGKTAVMDHLQPRLKWPILPVKFSIGEIIERFSLEQLLWRILFELRLAIQACGREIPLLEVPAITDLKAYPVPMFSQALDEFLARCRASAHAKDLRICLMLDEFAYLYVAIKKGQLSEDFMKTWKALLQKNYFTAFVVGHDIMREFMDRFSNELAVAHPYRCDYLSDEDARALADVPIRDGGPYGTSRYQGTALDELISLTACNPFYIQIFCDQLVKYMNSEATPRVTTADIAKVRDLLVSGNEAMALKDFDNLYTVGAEIPGVIPANDTLEVLKRVASLTQRGGCRISDLSDVTISCSPADILADLTRRDVLDIRNEAYKIRVGLFRDWLNAHPHAVVPS